MPEAPKRIRALDRGLAVIEHLSRSGQSSLADLRAQTGLSNATLLRILATMQDRNWVRRAIVEGKYELSHAIGTVLHSSRHAHPVAEVATPFMIRLTGSGIEWPSDLAVPIGPGVVEVVESTRKRGPLAPVRTAYGIRPSMVFSAHGRATLAFADAEQSAAHLAAIKAAGTTIEKQWMADGRLAAVIDETKRRGFGIREPEYWAEPFDFGPELGAIAVPVIANGDLFGTLSVLWLSTDATLDEFLATDRKDAVFQTATDIAARLAELNVSPVFDG